MGNGLETVSAGPHAAGAGGSSCNVLGGQECGGQHRRGRSTTAAVEQDSCSTQVQTCARSPRKLDLFRRRDGVNEAPGFFPSQRRRRVVASIPADCSIRGSNPLNKVFVSHTWVNPYATLRIGRLSFIKHGRKPDDLQRVAGTIMRMWNPCRRLSRVIAFLIE
jgi:hypothetical protein